MPTVNISDRVTLKLSPLYNQIPEWSDDRRISVFPPDQVFEVIEVGKSKLTLQAVDHEETRFFEWFKTAVKPVRETDKHEYLELQKQQDSLVERGILRGVSTGDPVLGLEPPEDEEDDGEDPARPIADVGISHIDMGELEEVANDRLFRPSNSDQGFAFEAAWCEKCDRYGANGNACKILANALIEYVEEWRYNKKGEPVCTAWKKKRQTKTAIVTEREPVALAIGRDGAKVEYREVQKTVEVEEIDPSKLLKYPDIEAEYKSPVMTYKGINYWIAGKLPDGKKVGEYHYYVEHNGKVTKSDLHHSGTTWANKWARKAIDRLTVLQEA